MKKTVMIAFLVFLMISSASAISQGFSISPSEWDADLVASNTHSENLTLSWEGDWDAKIELKTNISAENTNTEGVEVSYSKNNFTMEQGTSTDVELIVDTSPGLKSDTFNFTTYANIVQLYDEEGNPRGDQNFDRGVKDNSSLDGSVDEDFNESSQGGDNETGSENNESESGTDIGEITDPGDEDDPSALDEVTEALSSPVGASFVVVILGIFVAGFYFRERIMAWYQDLRKSEEEKNAEELPDA